MMLVNLHFGDHAYFPTDANGVVDLGRWEWSAPAEVPFGYNSGAALAAQIRYAGEDFENHVGTGSAAEISPVRSIDKIPVGNGKRGLITERFQNEFFGIVSGEKPDRHGWLTPVYNSKPEEQEAVPFESSLAHGK